jgi:dolichyl-phosphate-mannose-protein mannosyltransferase
LGAFLLFLPQIGFPKDYNFDEVHYVNAAKLLVPPTADTNWEHPPLGKYLIGLGIAFAGDRPTGWRLASMIFGALAVAGMYVWGLAIFRRRSLAVWIALLTSVNMMLFAVARVAMLDIFLLTFLVWGLAAASFAWDLRRTPREVQWLLAVAAALFGLAAACKWVGWVPLIFLWMLYGMLQIFRRTGAKLYRAAPEQRATVEEWYTEELWSGFRWHHALFCLFIVPVVAYAVNFIPFLWMKGLDSTYTDIVLLQRDMLFAQSHIVGEHRYASYWYQWPFDWKPMWFYFWSDKDWLRGILLIGNPVVFLPGLAAALFCAWAWWKHRTRDAFLSAVWYWLLLLCFAAIPRKVSFFHYYLPAACALSLALAYIFEHYGPPSIFRTPWGRWAYLGVAAAAFALFYPILSGMALPADFSPR